MDPVEFRSGTLLLKLLSLHSISLSQRRASVPRQIKPRTAGGESSSVKLRRSSSKTDLTAEGGAHRSVLSQAEPPDSLAAPASGFLAKVTCWQQRIDPEAEVNLNKRRKQQPRPASIAGSEAVSLKAVGGALKRVPSLGSMPVHAFGVNGVQLCLLLFSPPPLLPFSTPFYFLVCLCVLFCHPNPRTNFSDFNNLRGTVPRDGLGLACPAVKCKNDKLSKIF
jgi:hypothetical protein